MESNAMPALCDLDSLRQLQEDIEGFIQGLDRPVVVEDGAELFDLTSAQCRLGVEFGKLVFEAWSPARSIVRRVEGVACRDRGLIRVVVRKRAAAESSLLEFRGVGFAERAESVAPPLDRARFRLELPCLLGREFARCRPGRVSQPADRP